MTKFAPVVRPAERIAVCRCCDTGIPKGAEMVSWYSRRNRGQHIHICIPCACKIGDMVAACEPDGSAGPADRMVYAKLASGFTAEKALQHVQQVFGANMPAGAGNG